MSRNASIGLWLGVVIVALTLTLFYGGKLLTPFLGGAVPLEAPVPAEGAHGLVGAEAPYFDLPDLSGNRVRSSDFANAPVVLVFWGARESDAADQVKILDDWLSAGDLPVALVTINTQEEKSAVKSFIDRGAYAVPVLLDLEGETGRSYAVRTLPTAFFIDQGGIVRNVTVGIMSKTMLREDAEALLR